MKLNGEQTPLFERKRKLQKTHSQFTDNHYAAESWFYVLATLSLTLDCTKFRKIP